MACKENKKEEIIKPIPLNSWAEFKQEIKKDIEHYKRLENKLREKGGRESFSNLLFRGQAQACWLLETTLERFLNKTHISKKEYTWREYHQVLEHVYSSISPYLSSQFKLVDFEYPESPNNPHTPPNYEFLVYLRHHDFPSPLLDWTRCHYIAAYFAFQNLHEYDRVSIYSFMEFAGKMKNPKAPYYVWTAGPFINTHDRHYNQQSEYTHCFKKEEDQEERIYCSHEDLDYGKDENILKKYTLPVTERVKVLNELNCRNINEGKLFGENDRLELSDQVTERLGAAADQLFQ